MYPQVKHSRSRKKCPEGLNCPYKQEYQHDVEFSHDEVDAAVKTKKSRGEAKKPPESFAGNGQRLGESLALRESFQPMTLTSSSSSSNNSSSNSSSSSSSTGKSSSSSTGKSSSSSSSSTGKSHTTGKKKLDAVRAVRANAASGREQTASPITGRNGAGGCGRDGSGIFSSSDAINDREIEKKKLLKKRLPLSRVDMNSIGSAGSTSSLGPDHVAELPDNFCPTVTSRSATHSDRYSKQKVMEKVMATKNIIINIDCDDDDEIEFLGNACDSRSSNNAVRNLGTSGTSSSNHYDETRSYGGNTLPPIDRRSGAPQDTQQDDGFPIIIIDGNNRHNMGSDWNYRENSLASLPIGSTTRSTQSNYRSDFNENYVMHEASTFDERWTYPPSSTFPGDQMLKIHCEICNQKVTACINTYCL